ncbi:hypothetical protein C8T65DRAFT_280258 [Cerioporus squamosus]|nr:hypothetical protein C8T65DRAFT_280258 [Cerioporus squamosus]
MSVRSSNMCSLPSTGPVELSSSCSRTRISSRTNKMSPKLQRCDVPSLFRFAPGWPVSFRSYIDAGCCRLSSNPGSILISTVTTMTGWRLTTGTLKASRTGSPHSNRSQTSQTPLSPCSSRQPSERVQNATFVHIAVLYSSGLQKCQSAQLPQILLFSLLSGALSSPALHFPDSSEIYCFRCPPVKILSLSSHTMSLRRCLQPRPCLYPSSTRQLVRLPCISIFYSSPTSSPERPSSAIWGLPSHTHNWHAILTIRRYPPSSSFCTVTCNAYTTPNPQSDGPAREHPDRIYGVNRKVPNSSMFGRAAPSTVNVFSPSVACCVCDSSRWSSLR